MKVAKKILVIFLILISFICIISPRISLADDIKTEDYKLDNPLTYEEGKNFFDKATTILKLLRNLAAIVAVVSISILGLQYMIGSLEEKAQYKEKMLPIVIGAILIGSISSILIVINNIMN